MYRLGFYIQKYDEFNDVVYEKLSTKVILSVIVLILASVVVNYVVFMRGYSDDMEKALIGKAAAFTAVAEEAKHYQSGLLAKGTVDVEALAAEASAFIAKGGHDKETRLFDALPVVVGWTSAQQAADHENIEFKVWASSPRNKAHLPEAGTMGAQMLKDIELQVGRGGAEVRARFDRDTNTLRYMRAIKLGENCMSCHGDPAKYDQRDADGNFDGKDALGFAMENRKPGDMHGVYEVNLPLDVVDEHAASFMSAGVMW